MRGNLNKAIIMENHKPQTVEEIAHQLAGAVVFTKADAPQGLPTGTSDQGKQQVTGNKHSQRQVQVQENALWSQNVTGCLPDEDGPHHGKVPRSDKHPR